MFGALGMDFTRMYAFSGQLQTAADAAAMSAVIERRNNSTASSAVSRAADMLAWNRIDGINLARMTSSDVTFGRWDFSPEVFTTTTWDQASAVRVRLTYDAPWSLARIFGVTSRTLTRTSTAGLGSLSSSTCVKPWALPYSHLKLSLGYTATDTTSLTAEDIVDLASNRTEVRFSLGDKGKNGGMATIGAKGSPSPVYATMLGPLQYRDGSAGTPNGSASDYHSNIVAECGATEKVSLGDQLQLFDSDMELTTRDAFDKKCKQVIDKKDKKDDTDIACPSQLLLPVWSILNTSGSGRRSITVRYLAVFELTGYHHKKGFTGYFSALQEAPVGGGGLIGQPGPVSMPLLVR